MLVRCDDGAEYSLLDKVMAVVKEKRKAQPGKACDQLQPTAVLMEVKIMHNFKDVHVRSRWPLRPNVF